MKFISFLIVFLISSICFAQNFHMDTLASYKKCRQDFAVKLCRLNPDKYRCVRFYKDRQKYVTWDEIFGTSGERVKQMVQKVNRRNTLIWINHCIALPFNLSKDELEFSPFPKTSADNEKFITVDLGKLAWGAYKDGRLVKWGVANGGIGKCKETGKNTCKTPAGEWKIYEIKKGFQRSSLYPVECINKKECGHPYYNVMKFGLHGEALHGEKEGHVPGANISHGCVRIFKKDSKWLIENFIELGTKVFVEPY
ncbi:MAG: L,D-transpeptidase [Patescibacteria group bacterium]|jgi:hypothetical protein